MFPPNIQRIMFTEDDKEYTRWRVGCACDDARDDWYFNVEWDKVTNEVSLYVYAPMTWNGSVYKDNWFVEKWTNFASRCKMIWKVFVTGHIAMDSALLFKREADVKNLAIILLESITLLHERNEEYGTLNRDLLDT
jgi:hypothetical protein